MKTRIIPAKHKMLLVSCILSVLLITLGFNKASAQLYNLSPDDLKAFTPNNPYGRFPDGRPMIPDKVLDSVRQLNIQVIEAHSVVAAFMSGGGRGGGARGATAGAPAAGGRGGAAGAAGTAPAAAPAGGGGGGGGGKYYEDGWKMLDPNKKIYGRAATVQFMANRPELVAGMRYLADKNKTPIVSKAGSIDMLVNNDVAVIDLYGKVDGGLPYVGDKLGYYIQQTTGNGFIVDGGIYYLETMAAHGVQAFYRGGQLASTGQATVTGVNVPVQIGGIVVMPGDLIIGDQDGIIAVPPNLVHQLIQDCMGFRRRDEWIRAAFALKRYKSSEIYGTPKDPVLLKMFNDYKATGDKKYLPK
jgi:4-hydroxy-4-methyl-2-oxoglutarate aldolase